jgi:acyl-CoA synthetase (AMP-forming)/AMP-acid ligase II
MRLIILKPIPRPLPARSFVLGVRMWFRNVDLGSLDRDGFLFIKGSSKEMIKRGGDQVSPVEVEEILDTSTMSALAIWMPLRLHFMMY